MMESVHIVSLCGINLGCSGGHWWLVSADRDWKSDIGGLINRSLKIDLLCSLIYTMECSWALQGVIQFFANGKSTFYWSASPQVRWAGCTKDSIRVFGYQRPSLNPSNEHSSNIRNGSSKRVITPPFWTTVYSAATNRHYGGHRGNKPDGFIDGFVYLWWHTISSKHFLILTKERRRLTDDECIRSSSSPHTGSSCILFAATQDPSWPNSRMGMAGSRP